MGPFITIEPNVAGTGEILTVKVQSGIFSGLNLSGVSASVQSFASSDIDYVTPTTIKNLIVDAYGNASFRIVASNLANELSTIGVRFSGNVQQIGTQDVTVNGMGALALQLDDLLCAFRHIPRIEEPGRVSEDGSCAQWGWGNWHLTDEEPVILKNTNTWLSNSYQIDYKRGIVYFNTALEAGEEVRANYNFRMIDLAMYRNFCMAALDIINSRKPQTTFDFFNYPVYFNYGLLRYAYVLACQAITPKLSTFKYRRLFENPDQLLATLQTNMQLALADFNAWLLTIKRRGMTLPAAVTSFDVGRQGVWAWDGININNLIISRI